MGTTRNAVLRGSFSGSLTPIVQVLYRLSDVITLCLYAFRPYIFAKSQQDHNVFPQSHVARPQIINSICPGQGRGAGGRGPSAR